MLMSRPSLAPAEAVASHVDPLTPVDDDDVYLAAHFCNYAFAAYGYMLYIWSTPNKCALLSQGFGPGRVDPSALCLSSAAIG